MQNEKNVNVCGHRGTVTSKLANRTELRLPIGIFTYHKNCLTIDQVALIYGLGELQVVHVRGEKLVLGTKVKIRSVPAV